MNVVSAPRRLANLVVLALLVVVAGPRCAGAADPGGGSTASERPASAGTPAATHAPAPKPGMPGAHGSALLESTLEVQRFGTVHLYRPTEHPPRVVIFVSGDGRWNLGVIDMARALAMQNTLVIGVDIRHYMGEIAAQKAECAYSAADFEALSQTVQRKLGFPGYDPPVLVGYSSGATLVYAVIVEAPANTFRGGVGLGFCPDLDLPKPLCKGNGLEWDMGKHKNTYIFRAAPNPESPFIALQGEEDKVCDPPATEKFMQHVGKGRVIMLPKVGHGYSVPHNWQPQFMQAVASLAAPPAEGSARAAAPPAGAQRSSESVDDLPLVEVKAPGTPRHEIAVLLSGDGGWAGIDRDVGGALAKAGVPVVGWNSLQYYWSKKTPERAAADLERILRHYLAAWHGERVVLAGYSFGADVLPFLVQRLPPDLRQRVALVALLGPSPGASFEFHVGDWLGDSGDEIPTLPAVEALRGTPILCVYGEKESDSLCPKLPAGLAKMLPTAGAHHFGGDYEKLAAAILEAAGGR